MAWNLKRTIKIIHILLILVLLFCSGTQSVHSQDDLYEKWQNEKLADTIRVQSMQSHIWSFVFSNPDSSLTLVETLLEFSKSMFPKKERKKTRAEALYSKAMAYALRSESKLSLNVYDEVIPLYQELKDQSTLGDIYFSRGMVYRDLGDL
ncbi:hypothetical protein JYT74_01750 [Crocinitomix catalasitica]|nr:hypothetical protein [Crocinitomix catalasitica]